MQTFLVRHVLICSNGGIVIIPHNEIYDEIIHLAIQSFSLNCVYEKPLIRLGFWISEGWGVSLQERSRNTGWCVNQGSMGQPDISNNWFQVWIFWRGDMEARGNGWAFVSAVKINKYKHGKNFHEKRKNSLFVLLFDGMTIKEAQVVLATFNQLMAAKMDEPILHVKGWFIGRTTITVARSYSWVLCGAQVPSPLRTWKKNWASVLGLGLLQ